MREPALCPTPTVSSPGTLEELTLTDILGQYDICHLLLKLYSKGPHALCLCLCMNVQMCRCICLFVRVHVYEWVYLHMWIRIFVYVYVNLYNDIISTMPNILHTASLIFATIFE